MSGAAKVETFHWAKLIMDAKGAPTWSVAGKRDEDTNCVEFPARAWPPGTEIIVVEPKCPECEHHREYGTDLSTRRAGEVFKHKCACGFDWQSWEQNLRRQVAP